VRQAIFTHIVDNIDCPNFDRNKILITVHPTDRDVWYWLIPFGDGRCSVGVVAEQSYFEQFDGEPEDKLKHILTMDQRLKELLVNAEFKFPFRMITGYSANVKSLHGKGFALLGNAGEFLDPVFSSGVTIAMRSSSMAAALLDRQFQGESVDWQTEFAEPLKKGVDTFRTFVTAWYDQRFQDVIFHENKSEEVLRMIAAILAGYAWDEKNPYVADSERRLNVLVDLCRAQ
jgi:flavin-dependent dehydrogenase